MISQIVLAIASVVIAATVVPSPQSKPDPFKIATKGRSLFMMPDGMRRSDGIMRMQMKASGNALEFDKEDKAGGSAVRRRDNSETLDVALNGVGLITWAFWGGANQLFDLQKNADGTYAIMNAGKCMEVDKTGHLDGAACTQTDDQKFELVYPGTPAVSSSAVNSNANAVANANPPTMPTVVIIKHGSGRHGCHRHRIEGRHFACEDEVAEAMPFMAHKHRFVSGY